MNNAVGIAQTFGYIKARQQKYPEHLLMSAREARWTMPDAGTYENQAALYTKLSWIYSAISRTAETAAVQQLSVYKLQGEERKDIPNHPLELKLSDPNPKESGYELMVGTYSFLSLTGNCYWWLNKTSEKAEPSEIWIIPSYKMMPIPDEKMYLKGYAYSPTIGAEAIQIPTWQIAHFKTFNPLHEFLGLSGIEPLATISATDLRAQDWTSRFFGDNNARLPGILAFKDSLGDLAWNKIKSDTEQAAKERNFLMLRGVGDQVSWIQAAVGQKDMQYIEQRQFTKEEIYSIYAPGLASMIDVNATEANSKAGKQTYLEFAVYPRLIAVQQKITKNVLPAYGENLVAEYEDPRQVDRAIELDEQRQFAMTHTINEVRKEYYQDDELEDERGLLLPAQVGASPISMAIVTGEEPEIPPQFQQAQEPEQPIEEQPVEESEEQPPENPESEPVKAELKRWERKAINAVKRDKSAAVEFKSDIISPALKGAILGALECVKSVDDVVQVFNNVWLGYP